MESKKDEEKVKRMTDLVNDATRKTINTTAASKTYEEILQERKEQEEGSSKKKRKHRKKKNRFRKFFLIYCAALLFILIVGSLVFYVFLSKLENSQPYNTAASVAEIFNSGSSSLSEYLKENAQAASGLETDTEAVIEYYVSSLESEEEGSFSYVESSAYTETSPAYSITLDGETVADITLTSEHTSVFGLNDWVVSSINIADYITGTNEYDIYVPSGSSITVNGIALDETYLTGEDSTPEILANSTDYISSVPVYDVYHISGLINEPEISVSDSSGNSLSLVSSDSYYVAGTDTSDEFIASVSDRVMDAVEEWGTYFINKSYGLKSYMLSGTEWYAYIFGSDTMYPIYTAFYASDEIDSYEFTFTNAENYIKYSDDCFTVDVSYEMALTFTEEGYSDDNQNLYATWVWVTDDEGTWYIADVSYLDDEEEETEDSDETEDSEESETSSDEE